MTALAVNGLEMPPDFPLTAFERIYSRVLSREATSPPVVGEFRAAWNAVSIRFLTLGEEGDRYTESLNSSGRGSSHSERYRQERHLFGFFSSAFSAFEACFYGMYAIGALLEPAHFQIATPKDQQRVSPQTTQRAYTNAFVGDHILAGYQALFADPAYIELKEVRNILTHRSAPGRTIFVAVDTDQTLVGDWHVRNIPLDNSTTSMRRVEVARMLAALLEAAAVFAESRIT